MTNSADPDQLAPSETNWSKATLFAKTGHDVFTKRRVKRRDKLMYLKLLDEWCSAVSHLGLHCLHKPGSPDTWSR